MHDLCNLLIDKGFDPLGLVFSNLNKLYKVPLEDQKKIKGSLIAENFKYHYDHNENYRSACKERNISPADIRSYDDLIKIPLIPVRRFKDTDSHKLLSTTFDRVEYEMRSTGTSGIPSVSRRDFSTVTNAVHSLYAMYREFFAISNGAILYIMPSTEDIPEMGMIKVLGMLSGLSDAGTYMINQKRFEPEKGLEILNKWENHHTRHIVGPPFLIYKFINYLKTKDIKLNLDKHTKVINLGGWKRFTGQEIPREAYNAECAKYFGINPDQVRDMYGLVEANCLAVECEHQNKHVPPWVHFSVRDLNDLSKEVSNGKRGVLAILDPTSTSYPTFILTEDMVYLSDIDTCDCGRTGQIVNYISRVRGAEIGCCAINLERQMDEAERNAQVDKGCIVT